MGFISDAFGAGEAGDAGKAAAQGFKESEDILTDYGQKSLGYLEPFKQVGKYGLNNLAAVYNNPNGPDYSQFRDSPGYQFSFDEGQKAVENSGSARGMNLSGAQLKGLTRYGQGTADQGFNNWFNRNMGMAGFGQQNANQMAALNQDTGSGIASARQGIGEARASGYMAQANQKNSMANNVLSGVTGGLLK